MKYELSPLPYAEDALEPVISRETVECHYGKHEQAYIDKLNALTAGTEWEQKPLEEIVASADGALFNNASQAWNHLFYFFSFAPDGRHEPEGRLSDAICRKWGSFGAFREAFEQAGAGLFGSGWVWLCSDKAGDLSIEAESNAGNPLTRGLIPLLTFDVWEHAYYLDYQNRRADHLRQLWQIVDWRVVESRYK